jgi:anti-sigma factor RsiW
VAIGTTLVALAVFLWSVRPPLFTPSPVTISLEEVLAAHVRSLMADHLTDLASSDRHSVKPWLSNRLDFAPPVQDFAKEGFILVGGRLDYLGEKAVAAVVYRYRRHLINVFIWPATTPQDTSVELATQRGYSSARFDAGDMSYWVVSDLNGQDLGKLADLLRRAS